MAKGDIIGQRFGRLLALRRVAEVGRGRYWAVFACDCGATTTAYIYSVTGGDTKSCGCLKAESARERFTKHGYAGADRETEYEIWCGMRRRCKTHPDYAGRGISIAEEWSDFTTFLRDVGPRPLGTTLERRRNDEGYGPGNCYWATWSEQNRNKRNNVNLTFNGKTMCATAWAEMYGLKPCLLLQRIHNGWSVERAITSPLRRR